MFAAAMSRHCRRHLFAATIAATTSKPLIWKGNALGLAERKRKAPEV